MKILVTGVGGNVGQFLAQELSKKYEIWGVYRTRMPVDAKYNLIQADLSEEEIDLTGIDIVLHVAAGIEGSALSLVKNNIYATNNLLTAATKANVKRFIYFSTVSVYGNTSGKVNEESSRINVGTYGTTKFLAEELVRESNIENKVIIELPRMLGPFVDLYNTNGSGFITMTRKIVDNENVECFIPDVKYNNFMHVCDLVEFVEKLIDVGNWQYEKVLLAAKNSLTMMDILEIMKTSINSRSKLIAKPNGSTPACSLVNISRALSLGYNPKNTEEILVQFIGEMKKDI